MAKAKIKGLDEAVEEVYKDYKKAIKKAAQEAVKKAAFDFKAKAVSCLVAYYDDYPNPTQYSRTYNLINSLVSYADDVIEEDGNFICSARIDFDPERIDGDYNGSYKYSPTSSEWIIDNFLAGIHPRTDGYHTPHDDPDYLPHQGNYMTERYQGSVIPGSILDAYIKNYEDTFLRNYRMALGRQVLMLAKK